MRMMNFSSNAINGVIGGLVPNSGDYQFTISMTIIIKDAVPQRSSSTIDCCCCVINKLFILFVILIAIFSSCFHDKAVILLIRLF